MVEGGGKTHASFLQAGLVNRVTWFIAPKIIGGRDAPTSVEGDGLATMQEAWQLDEIEISRLDDDVVITGLVRYNTSVRSS